MSSAATGRAPELLAPGGSYQSAWHAFEAGADGVYLGLTEFSARAAAVNFTFDQLRRVRALAGERGKRIYVAVNTVVRDGELGRLAESLFRLESLGVDGVIVQDLGVLEVLSRFFPGIPVHASTQMAVHTSCGIAAVKRLGVRRVILSRELPLRRIQELRRLHPDMELEVFIHGALCYSFSGICLASHALTGRSGNRGECAQICRSLFTGERDGGQSGYFFSCRDLFLGRDVLDLARAGVTALKIEGRMKAPEYVLQAVRLYREVLDRGETLPGRELEILVRRTELTFSRRRTGGYLRSPHGTALIDAEYPGHRGALLGRVSAVRKGEMTVTLAGDLSLHDGLAFWVRGEGAARGGKQDQAPGEPVIFSVQGITRSGREARFARAGETVGISLPAALRAAPEAGTEIRHLSSRFLDLPQVKETSVRPFRVPLDMAVTLSPEQGGTLSARVTGGPFSAPSGGPEGEQFSAPVSFEPASRRRPFGEVLGALLSESGESFFTLGRLSLVNRTGLPDDGIFVPPARLKAIKNELYRSLDERLGELSAERARVVTAPLPRGASGQTAAASGEGTPGAVTPDASAFADRALLSPGPIPFAGLGPDGRLSGELAQLQGFLVVPLPPVMSDEEVWLFALEREIEARPAESFAVGLSNVGHLEMARRIGGSDRVCFFVDFPLYAANRHAVALLAREAPRMLFQYHWIEAGEDELPALREAAGSRAPLLRVHPSFRPPLFYSLGCFERHNRNGGACYDNCPKEFSEDLRQGRNRFRLVVRDCVTYLFGKP